MTLLCLGGIKKMSFFAIDFASVKMVSHLRRFFGWFFTGVFKGNQTVGLNRLYIGSVK